MIGCPPTAERQKIGFDPICYGTAVTAQRQVATPTAQRNFSRRQRNSYSANVILTEFTQWERRNGNGRTETEWWKPGITEKRMNTAYHTNEKGGSKKQYVLIYI